MIDFTKYTVGHVVHIHCCNKCAGRHGITPKVPADSGKSSWLCKICGHYGIGSRVACKIGDWLQIRPIKPEVTYTEDSSVKG